jgi:hypothetical protein
MKADDDYEEFESFRAHEQAATRIPV